jgi:hypothetical protein
VSSSPPAPPISVSILCFKNEMIEPEIKVPAWIDSFSAQ